MAESARVVYAPARAAPVELELPVAPEMTIAQAVRLSGMLERFPEIDLAQGKIGVWGKLRDPASLVAPGDRVEIYRPLSADPKASRSRRASRKAKEK
jgi:hypothetical protein